MGKEIETFKGNRVEIVKERLLPNLLREHILLYAKKTDIAEIFTKLEYVYYQKIKQEDFISWCKHLYDKKYSLEEQIDKFINMYKENYLTGFVSYIR